MNRDESIWSLYLIQCRDGSLYCGITTDVARRFSEHTSQGNKCAKYLRGREPLRLVYFRNIGDRSEASREEIRVKKLSRDEKKRMASTFCGTIPEWDSHPAS